MSTERSNTKVKPRLPRLKRLLARLRDDERLAWLDWHTTHDDNYMVVIVPIHRPMLKET